MPEFERKWPWSGAKMASIVTAIEAYYVDNNAHPPFGDGVNVNIYGLSEQFLEPRWLTSPTSYLGKRSVDIYDPFRKKRGIEGNDARYDYVNWKACVANGTAAEEMASYFGAWRLAGSGPDGFFWNKDLQGDAGRPGTSSLSVIPYDPTNGIVSVGDVIRTHKKMNWRETRFF